MTLTLRELIDELSQMLAAYPARDLANTGIAKVSWCGPACVELEGTVEPSAVEDLRDQLRQSENEFAEADAECDRLMTENRKLRAMVKALETA